MADQLISVTDEAIRQILQKQKEERFSYIRLGITGGGCAGFEYIFDSSNVQDPNDVVLDYGKWKFLIDKVSLPYINGMTLDYVKEGLNSFFKFINPKEQSSCGCGVSINFDLDAVEADKDKTFAIEV